MTASSGTGQAGELAARIRDLISRGSSVLEVVAAINAFYEERGLGRIIVVGGYAAEIYTGSAYRTGDVDLVVEGSLETLREALGLIEEWKGRVWAARGLRYAIDIVSTEYRGKRPPVKLRMGEMYVYVEPPEETIVSSLNACVYWESDLDCERAAMILAAQWDRLDWEYLESRAREEGVAEKLLEIRRAVEPVVSRGLGST